MGEISGLSPLTPPPEDGDFLPKISEIKGVDAKVLKVALAEFNRKAEKADQITVPKGTDDTKLKSFVDKHIEEHPEIHSNFIDVVEEALIHKKKAALELLPLIDKVSLLHSLKEAREALENAFIEHLGSEKQAGFNAFKAEKQKEFQNAAVSYKLPLDIAKAAAENKSFKDKIEAMFKSHALAMAHKSLKPGSSSASLEGLDLAKASHAFVKKLESRCHVPLKQIKEDAKTLAKTFTPRTCISKDGHGNIQEKPLQGTDLSAVDAIIINGNNDLRQVDQAAMVYRKIKKDYNHQPKIFISGYGGHGTSPGPIFAKTEADTMAQRLMDLGVEKSQIVIENKATNSGQNVQFLTQHLKANGSPKNILICGTPSAVCRQVRSFEKQAQYDWQSLMTDPTPSLEKEYFGNERDALINMMGNLREVGSFIDYTLNSEYMSARELPDPDQLKADFQVFFKYYYLLASPKKKLNEAEIEELAKNFIAYSQMKAEGRLKDNATADAIKTEFNKEVKQAWDYFRRAFTQIEYAWMEVLSSELTDEQQRKLLNDFSNQTINALNIES